MWEACGWAVALCSRSARGFGVLAQLPAVASLEAAIARFTPPSELAAGRRCCAQSDGLVTAGVPIGSPAFQRACATATLEEHTRTHVELSHLGDVQSACLLLRYSLSVRFSSFLLAVLGPVLLEPAAGHALSPVEIHDAQLQRSLAVLLASPMCESVDARLAAAADGLPPLALAQAALPVRRGGLSLPTASLMWASAHLALAMPSLSFLRAHARALCLEGVDLSAASALPFFDGLRAATTHLGMQRDEPTLDLSILLSGEPTSQHDLSFGGCIRARVYARSRCAA